MDAVSPLKTLIILLVAGCLTGMLATQVAVGLVLSTGKGILPPPTKVRAVPWSAGSVFAVILLYFLTGLVVLQTYETIRSPAARNEPNAVAVEDKGDLAEEEKTSTSFTERLGLVSAVNLVLVFAIPVLLRVTSGATFRDLGLSFEHFSNNLFLGGFAFFLVTPWVYGVNFLAVKLMGKSTHPLERMIREEWGPGAAGLAMLSAVILAPLAEEIIFRGVLLGWLSRPRNDEWKSSREAIPSEADPQTDLPAEAESPPDRSEWGPILGSSIPFALVHASEMPAPFAIFVLSIALGFLARRTGSLVGPIVLHSLFNGFSTLMLIGAML